MSTTIDQRVVEMRFDNKQFESATATSMSTIDKLKQKLNFTGASKGLENVSAAAKKVDMNGLGSAVDTVKVKFSALEVMGVTALANITNSAINAGKRMVSALTIDPIKTGFQEYETQINAVQTILANTQSKGSTINDVSAALDELNKYADQTIYNFTEMTRNIGTFTAAGVDLDKSVTSIKGIANLAAVSGSNAQQASTAMYQLSQAIAAGKVSLMDWNSVVNAGMGGEVFQNALKRTAEHFGTNVDGMIEKYGSFRESLTKGEWLTTEVLTETLTQLSGAYSEADLIAQGYTQSQAKEIAQLAETALSAATDVKTFTQLWDTLKEAAQSGWTQSWELIIGDFEQAKELFSDLSTIFGDLINSSAEARNSMLEGAMTSKWDQLTKQINHAGVATEDFNTELAKTVKSHGTNVDELTKKYGSLGKAFQAGAISSDLIVETLKRMGGASSEFSGATEDMTGKLKEFQQVVQKVWQGDFKNGEERVKALTAAGYDYAKVQDLVNKTAKGQEITLEDLSDAQMKSIGYTDDQIKKIRELGEQAEKTGTPLNKLIEDISKPSGRELLWDSILNILKSIISVAKSVGQAWKDAFPPMTSEQLYNLIDGFHSFTETLIPTEQTLKNITSTFKGLFAVLDIFATITGGALRIGLRALGSVLGFVDGGILGVTASLGEMIAGFRDWLFENNLLVKGLEKLGSGIASGVSAVRDWIKAFMELPVVQENIARMQKVFSQTLSNLQDYFAGGMERISEFIGRVRELDSLTLDDVKNIFRDFKDNVVDYFLNIGDVFSNLGTAIVQFKDNIVEYFKTAGDSLGKFGKKVIDFMTAIKEKLSDNIGIGEILTIGVGAGIIYFAKKLGDIIGLLAAPLSSFVEIFDGLGDVLEGYSRKLKAEALLKIAQAIATLAGAVAVLALLDQGKVWSSVGVLTVLAAGLTALSLALGAFNKIGGVTKASVSLVSLSTSVLILTTALKQMESLNRENLAGNLAILGTLAIGLAGVSAVLGRMAPQLSKGSIFLLSFAVSLKILVSALSDLEGVDSRHIGDTMVSLLGVIGMMRLLVTATKGASLNAAAGIVGIAMTLKILIGAFDDIAELDTGKMKSNIEAFVAIFGMFSVLMVSSKFAGANASKAGLGIIAMSAALILIVQAFKMMAELDPSLLDRASDTVAKLLVVFAAVVAVSNFAGANAAKAGAMLLLMSGAILILSGVMALLTKLDPEGLDRALKAIVTLELVFGALIAVSRIAGENKATIMTLTVTIGALALAIGALAFINEESLKSATTALSSVMGMFAVLVASTKLAQKASGTLIIMTGVVAALGGILFMLSGLPAETTLATAEALSLLLTSLSASLLIVSNAKHVSSSAYAALGVMTLTVAGLAAIIGVLASMDVGPTLEISQSLSLLLTALSGACVILSGVGMLGTAAVKGALALDGVIVVVGGLMVGIGALAAYYPDMELFVNKGIGLLEAVGRGIGSFVGGIVGGFAEGITAGLPGIAANLSSFMDSLQPFLTATSSIDARSVEGVKMLAETMLILTGTSLLDKLTSWITGGSSLTSFAEQLVPFGNAMKAFSDSIAGLDANLVTNAATAGKSMAEMAATLPNSGGVVGFFAGENDMDAFAKQLVPFGKAMKEFSGAVAGLDSNLVTNAATAGKAIAEMATTLPNSGGVVGFFAGENDMSMFASQLVPFGKAMKEFSMAVTGLDSNLVVNASTAGKAIAEMAATLPNSGGVLGFFSGENDMSMFASQLVPFGTAMKEYSLAIAGLDVNAITNSTTAGQALVELANTLPNSGGLFTFFTGDNDMSTFGKELVSFGANFKTYSTHIQGVDANVVTTTANAAQSLVTLANSLPDSGGWFNDATTLDTFGSQLSKFGEYFSNYYSQISGINSYKLSTVISEMSKLVDLASSMSGIDTSGMSNFGKALGNLGKAGVDQFIQAFTNANSRVSQAADGMLSTFVTAVNTKSSEITTEFNRMMNEILQTITTKQSEIGNAAETLVDRFSKAITSKSKTVIMAFTQMMNQSILVIRNKHIEFVSAGSYIVEGLANGIRANQYKAVEQARAMAQAVEEASKNSLGIHSPSLAFFNIGAFAVMGLVNGIANHLPDAKKVSSNLGNTLVTSIRDTLGMQTPPSVVMNEVGHYVVLGLAEGIEEDMSAEEAIKQKAQNIVTAFQKEFSKLDTSMNTTNLEYQLWEKLNPNASEAEKKQAELDLLQKKIENQTAVVKATQAQYKATVDQLGASSLEAHEAYNKVLQAQIDLASTVEELNTIREESIEKNRNAAEKYGQTFDKIRDNMEKQGFSLEEIQKAAADLSGFDPNFLTSNMELDVKQVVADAMSDVQVAYAEAAGDTLNKLVESSSGIGSSMAKAIGDSVVKETPKVAENVTTMVETGADKIEENQPMWHDGASALIDAFIVGIEDKIGAAAAAAAKMAATAYQAAMSAFGGSSDAVDNISNTVSNAVSDGVSKGGTSKKSTSGIAKMAASGISAVVSTVVSAINDGIDSEPTIRPVLDLSNVKSGMSKLDTMVSASRASSISVGMSDKSSSGGQNGDKTSSGGNVQFVQNNYSPKALSRVEIYRQTNNQLSAFERKVKA